MSTITNNIFSTVSMLADKAIASFKPDKSVTGIITSTSKDLEGVYGVQVNSTNFTAKSIGNEQYNIGDVVYLLIPDNELSNTKFILGSTNKKSSNLKEENSIDKEFSFLGSGVIINNYKGENNPDIVFTPLTPSSTSVEKTKWITTSITKKGEDSSRVVYATTQIYLPDIAEEDLTINQMKVTVSTGGNIILSDLKSVQMTIEKIEDYKYNLIYYFNDNVASGGYDNPATAVSFEIKYTGYKYESGIIYSYNGSSKSVSNIIKDEDLFLKDLAALESKFKDDTTAFIVSADFKSNYPNIQTGGTFGIKVKIKYTDGEREYVFSSSEMQAENVYMMLDYTEQKKAFENIDNETFEYISEISIFNTMGSGLEIKNLEIYGAKRVASSIPTYTLSIDSITGVTDISNLEASSITLKAVLKDSNQKVIQNTTYTWYQENVTVEDGASEKGGAGWAHLLDNNIDNELTISSSSQFTSTSCRFKCIATTSSGMSFDAYYTLYNKEGINLSLTRKDDILTCSAKDNQNNEVTGLSYQWYEMLNNGTTWDILTDKKNNSLTVDPNAININKKYRCVVSYTTDGTYVGYVETKVYNPQYENVRTIELYYMRSNSYTDAPPAEGEEADWQKTIPEETEGKIYIWQKTVTIYEDGREVVNSIVQIKGIPGEKGADGIGQKEQLFLYAYTDSVSEDDGKPVMPDISEIKNPNSLPDPLPKPWQYNTQPVTKELPYQWKYTFIIYTDNTYVTDGPTLEAIWADGIESITTQWAVSDNGTNAPAKDLEGVANGGWTDVFSEVTNTNKQYIWVREKITYKSTAVSYTTPRVDLANNAIKNWVISTDQTYINGAKIYTGTIDASKISVDDLSATNATIGGWSIGETSIYYQDQEQDNNVLISAYAPSSGETVQRFAAGKNPTFIEEETRTEEIVYSRTELVFDSEKKEYVVSNKEIDLPFLAREAEGEGWTKVQVSFDRGNGWEALATYTDNTDIFKLKKYDNSAWRYSFYHRFNNWDKDNDILQKLKYEITYPSMSGMQSINDPVFQLLSDGTGTIGGWDIAQDGLSKVEWKDETKKEIEKEVVFTTSDSKLIKSEFGSEISARLFVLDNGSPQSLTVDYSQSFTSESDQISLPDGKGGEIQVDPSTHLICWFTLPDNVNFDILKDKSFKTTKISVINENGGTEETYEQIIYLRDFKTNNNKIYGCAKEIGSAYFTDIALTPEDLKAEISYLTSGECEILANGVIQSSFGISSNILKVNYITFSQVPGSSIVPTDGQGGMLLQGTWKTESSNAVISDKRFKNSILSIPEKYSQVFDKLHPVIFKYNNGSSGRYHIGFIAQEVAQAVEEAGLDLNEFAAVTIGQSSGDSWGIRYEEFVALNVYEIQQLKEQVTQIKAENENLKQALKLLIQGNAEEALNIINNS